MSSGPTFPELVSLSFPNVIDLGEGDVEVTFSAEAFDEAGIDNVVIWLDQDMRFGNSTYDLVGLYGNSDDWADGTSSRTAIVPQEASAGEYNITHVWVTDINGNRTTVDATELEGMGVNTSFEIVGGIEAANPPEAPVLSLIPQAEADTLTVQIVNEGEPLAGAELSGNLIFSVSGASYDSINAFGSASLNSQMSSTDGIFEITFTASFADTFPSGTTLTEVSFDVLDAGELNFVDASLTLDNQTMTPAPFNTLAFEAPAAPVPDLVARDVATSAIEGSNPVTGNALLNDDGEEISVIEINGDDSSVGMVVSGTYGSLTMDYDGSYSYAPGSILSLPGGEQSEDVFSYTVTGIAGNSAVANLVITVTGINDLANITGNTRGEVTEAALNQQVATGVLSVDDPDAGENLFIDPEPAALTGSYGSFDFDPETGNWAFTLDNEAEAVTALLAGEEGADSLTVTSLDGTSSETISVTVTGAGLPDVKVAGKVVYQNGEEMAGTMVTFTHDEAESVVAETDAGGSFIFDLAAGSSGSLSAVRQYSSGDADITARDALDVLRLAVGLEPSWGVAEAHDFIAADINHDGQVSATDALEVLRHAVGLESEHTPEWIFLNENLDLGSVARDNVDYGRGLDIGPIENDIDLAMTGILLGSMQDHV